MARAPLLHSDLHFLLPIRPHTDRPLQKRAQHTRIRNLPLLTATLAYVALHFLILPNWQEGWVGIFYLGMVISAVKATEERSQQVV